MGNIHTRHGGDDPGTSANDIVEKDLTLEISKYMSERLNDLGITNSLTRTTDETLGPDDRPDRVQSFYGNGSDVIVVSNHINAGGGDGAEIIYSLRNSDKLSSIISDNMSSAGQNVRKYYQRRLPSNPEKDYYYILRDTANNESIIVEYGFADSTEDDVKQLKNNWKDLAEAVVKSLASYMGVKYTPVSSSDNTYVVKSGDTLWSIAKNNGLTVSELKSLNDLTSNTLSIGQVLKLSDSDTTDSNDNTYYIVQKGDTLYGIASKYDLSVAELKSLNNLTTNALSIGQKLIVSSDNNDDYSNEYYVVKSGDTLYGIANSYNTTVAELKDLNNLSSNTLSIGMKLKVPNTEDEKVYTVQKGDTLYSIAKDNNTTVTNVINANNLTSTTLMIGQQLLIP